MQNKDLRIGNLILFHEDSTVFELEEIFEGGYSVKNKEEATWIEKDMFSGIKITKEWLLNFGFKLGDNITTNDSFFTIRLSASEFAINPDNGVVWITNPKGECFNNPCLVEFVHQLQNIYFALTGEELPLKETL